MGNAEEVPIHHRGRLLIHHLAYLLAYAQRIPSKGGPAISLNIIIPISGISHILHSYPYRIRMPSGDCPNTSRRNLYAKEHSPGKQRGNKKSAGMKAPEAPLLRRSRRLRPQWFCLSRAFEIWVQYWSKNLPLPEQKLCIANRPTSLTTWQSSLRDNPLIGDSPWSDLVM
jgi:hypothetical protein